MTSLGALPAGIGAAHAQSVTVTGGNGQPGGEGPCNAVHVPSQCPTETRSAIGPVNAPTWTHAAGPEPGVLIGANLGNSDSGPAVSGSASVTGGGVANTGRVWVGFEGGVFGSIHISGSGSRWTAGGNAGQSRPASCGSSNTTTAAVPDDRAAAIEAHSGSQGGSREGRMPWPGSRLHPALRITLTKKPSVPVRRGVRRRPSGVARPAFRS